MVDSLVLNLIAVRAVTSNRFVKLKGPERAMLPFRTARRGARAEAA
jgi:hypothetical protein